MPIDWDEFDSEIDTIIEASSAATDKRLASRISSITHLTDEEVTELFPETADVKKLAELMKIVKSSEQRHQKINRLVADAEKYSGVVLTLLQRFA